MYQLNNLLKREFSSKSFYIPLGQASLKSIEQVFSASPENIFSNSGFEYKIYVLHNIP